MTAEPRRPGTAPSEAPASQTADDRELVITRTLDAPRSLVWQAWTDAERIAQWMAPAGFAIPLSEAEPRPNGAWREHMRTPDGTVLECGGVYREVSPPERLVFTHAWTEGGTRGHETIVTVTLAERDGGTVMTFHQGRFPAAEPRNAHADGWRQCFDRLESLLAKAD